MLTVFVGWSLHYVSTSTTKYRMWLSQSSMSSTTTTTHQPVEWAVMNAPIHLSVQEQCILSAIYINLAHAIDFMREQ